MIAGFARPANAALFAPVWPDLVEAFLSYESAGIVDLGRMGPQGLPQSMPQRADLVALVTRSSLRSLAAARSYAGMLADQERVHAGDHNAGLIVIGEHKPYREREIAGLLQLPVVSAIADDPAPAAALSEGTKRPRKFDHGPLAKSLHHAVGDLRRRMEHRRERSGESDGNDSADEPKHPDIERQRVTAGTGGGPGQMTPELEPSRSDD